MISRIFNAIKARIINFYRKNIEPSKHKWSEEKLIKGVMRGYKANHGYEFDIHNPMMFTEKIQWYKIFYKKEGLYNIVDKYLFKGYIEEKLGKGYTIPLFGAWDNLKDLEKAWDSLPNQFVLKSTLQSDSRCIEIIKDKSKVDFQKLKKELKQWLKVKNTLINSYCRAYYEAKPRILAEQYVENIENQLFDYKIFCFNGQPYCTYVVTERFVSEYTITFYDVEWNKIDVTLNGKPNTNISMPKPKHYDEMLEISRKLSKDFPFVRVDFFDLEDKLYIAELTFYPSGGFSKFEPNSFNKQLGDLFVVV